MTTQINLNRVWASTGSATDPNATNYNFGWVVEIPTYQEFNYVLKGIDTNLLVLAEQSYFTWDATITYSIGAKVLLNNKTYTCRAVNTNVNPELDTTYSYWVKGATLGGLNNGLLASKGLLIKDLNIRSAINWWGNDLTLENKITTIAFNSDLYNNWVLSNAAGNMVLVNVGNTSVPDGRNISAGQQNVYKLYHEGNKPVVADVNGAVPTNLIDSKLYARRNSNWEELLVPTQAEAEAGVVTTSKLWSALRVKQAIQALVKSATESIAGIAEIATQVETDAGTDDLRFVTPKKIKFGFSILLATNGYIVFPTWLSGFKIAWADGIFANGSDQTQTINFPIVFSTFAKVGVFTKGNSFNLSDAWCQLLSSTLSSAYVVSQWSGTGNITGGTTPSIIVWGK